MKKALLIALIQVGVILAWTGQQEYFWATLPTTKLELAPADPIDPLRGRYFILNPRMHRLENLDFKSEPLRSFLTELIADQKIPSLPENPKLPEPNWNYWRGEAYVVLEETSDGIARPKRISAHKPLAQKDQIVLYFPKAYLQRGHDSSQNQATFSANSPLSPFYIPNRLVLPARENEQGWTVEVLLRGNGTVSPKALWFREKRVFPRSE